MKIKLLFALAWLLGALSAVADVGIELSPIFTAGQDGYSIYRIPVAVVTTNGTVLLFCEGRKNGREDSGAIDMLLKRSTDGGKNWGAQQIVWTDAANTCGNPAPVVDRTTGFIWLLMTWNAGDDTSQAINAGTSKTSRRVFVTHSEDDGRTWAKPADI